MLKLFSYFCKMYIVLFYFKEIINELAYKWLVAQTTAFFYLYVMKTEARTYLCGPYWTSLQSHHNIGVGDVVTLELFNDDEANENDEEEAEELVKDGMVYLTMHDCVGNYKPHVDLPSKILCLFCVCQIAEIVVYMVHLYHVFCYCIIS